MEGCYEMSGEPPVTTLRFVRSADDRVLTGVAGGLGERLGVDPVLVRIVLVVLAFAGGMGVLVYGAAWAMSVEAGPDHDRRPPRVLRVEQTVALGLMLLGTLLVLRRAGLWFGDALVWPVALAAAGSAVVWVHGTERDRLRFSRMASRLPGMVPRRLRAEVPIDVAASPAGPVSLVRLLVGVVLIGIAMAGFLAANDAFSALGDLGLALVTALVGMALLLGPWITRLGSQVRDERRERIRSEERAEVAAHLHDSVLQTLALIQRSAEQPGRMVALARTQERELRAWLYRRGDTRTATTTLTTAVEDLADEIEASYDVTVETVVVGESVLDADVRALLAATREALLNAARHADVDQVSAYVEAQPQAVVAYVRDRGTGFDPDRVPEDRHGIAASIRARLARHGGSATVLSAPGEGTEVELRLPRSGNGASR